jgi:hypothetical protein
MKKLLVLVSCVAAVLIVSNVSFAQVELAEPVEVAVPSACEAAPIAVPAPAPFMYPPYPYAAPARFPLLASRRAARMLPVAPPMMAGPEALPYPPYPPAVGMRPFAARRAARMAALAQPYPMPMPVGAPAMPMVAGVPVETAPGAPMTYGPSGQTGKRNLSFQRTGTTGPVINFLSIVRTQPNPYAGLVPAYPAPSVQ